MAKKTKAKTNTKTKSKKNRIETSEAAKKPEDSTTPSGGGMYALRETIESIVIAFVLAFLFRTFEAEAFVIPTGSMSPSLQGQHKDICCSECGYRFRTNASTEGEDRERMLAMLRNSNLSFRERSVLEHNVASQEVVLGMCPMCRQSIAMRPESDLPPSVPSFVGTNDAQHETSYPGDRILVNKYAYEGGDPERWDVVVFKFPGNGEMNYIKRLVGLPNETLQLSQGDLFVRDDEQGEATFAIERKPAHKVRVMLQPVHDTDYDPTILHSAGWPLRWQAMEPNGWTIDAEPGDQTVAQSFSVDAGDETAWLRYRHYTPRDKDWLVAREYHDSGEYPVLEKQQWLDSIKPQLIRDFNSYNAGRLRGGAIRRSEGGRLLPPGIEDQGWPTPETSYGLCWVGDLAVQADVQIEQSQGELALDLVEAGTHFVCRIDLKTGQAQVGIAGRDAPTATAQTPITSPGSYNLLFANVDDQLLLWVDESLVELTDSSAALVYDADAVFGKRVNAIPRTSEDDPGDLAPVGIGAQGTSVNVSRLQVMRDIYYIATTSETASPLDNNCDYPRPSDNGVRQLFEDPDKWPLFYERKSFDFSTEEDQLFVMGDNSPQSEDCRLWARGRNGAKPGGAYLDRRLLIGKAVCVFWPHSWGEIPGLRKLPGFPNFGDMRLVR